MHFTIRSESTWSDFSHKFHVIKWCISDARPQEPKFLNHSIWSFVHKLKAIVENRSRVSLSVSLLYVTAPQKFKWMKWRLNRLKWLALFKNWRCVSIDIFQNWSIPNNEQCNAYSMDGVIDDFIQEMLAAIFQFHTKANSIPSVVFTSNWSDKEMENQMYIYECLVW